MSDLQGGYQIWKKKRANLHAFLNSYCFCDYKVYVLTYQQSSADIIILKREKGYFRRVMSCCAAIMFIMQPFSETFPHTLHLTTREGKPCVFSIYSAICFYFHFAATSMVGKHTWLSFPLLAVPISKWTSAAFFHLQTHSRKTTYDPISPPNFVIN